MFPIHLITYKFMSTLFSNLNIIRNRLIDYLYTINENINWTDFFNQYGTMADKRILKRIRSLVWIDKSIEYDSTMQSTLKYFKYYVSLLVKFESIMYKHGPIFIIPPKTVKNGDILNEFELDVYEKYSILTRILNIMNVKFEDIKMDRIDSNELNKMNIIIPTGSITYDQETINKFKQFNGVVIPDGYDNICFNENDELLNNCILNIKALMMSPNDVTEIIKTDYTMFYITKTK